MAAIKAESDKRLFHSCKFGTLGAGRPFGIDRSILILNLSARLNT